MSFLSGPSRRSDARNDNGPVTYRHLLSPQSMTVFNPLRTIAHCDIDAAYAQFEQVRLGLPDDIPLICAQWQSIIAVNYPARKYGIKRFTTLDEARKMCPELVVQHVATYRNGESEAGYWGEVDPQTHKVSLDPYRRESLKILAIFKEMVPKGEIEKASIDEAFLDLTPMVLEKLLTLHPYLSTIPDDAPEGIDSPLPPPPPINWSKAGNVFPINGESEDQTSNDTWEDWALCIGAEIMRDTRDEVFRQLHYTCSAGIAHNKAMAKLCSAWKKPNNQTVLRANATAAFLRDRDFTDIRTLGGKLGNAMATEYGAKTVGDMLLVPLEEMQSRFGEESIWVYNILRGIDHTEVKGRVATKSMLASKNVRPNVRTPEQGHHWLSVLSGELNVRLREAREVAPGLWPKTLVLSIDPSRSRQTPFPFTRHLSTEYILKYARKLWEEATLPMKNGTMKLNNIALSFTGLERLEGGQQGIENFFAQPKASSSSTPMQDTQILRPPLSADNSSSSSTIPTISNLAKRPLSPTLTPSSSSAGPSPKKPRLPTLHTGKKKMGLDAFLTKRGESSAIKREESPSLAALSSTSLPIEIGDDDDVLLGAEAVNEDEIAEAGPSRVNQVLPPDDVGRWTCPKCHETISTPEDLQEEERAMLLRALKQEHEDWHFALSLQDGDHGKRPAKSSSNRSNGGEGSTVKKRKKKVEGIKAFFKPK
uniref:DNA polymerase eta n=1 Tax=Kwoniella bestiolae CBS 10118 TaxID=1296100 RepID=A0A1B9FXV4_9TREE|nr:DNA polymerase eta subunit [Kwoniella bestiolae CBS 10118]OCF23580.1 DNA polymerase eta subunit [Kwoniella bestiolae CBS 10118]